MDKRPEGIDPDWIKLEFKVPKEYAGQRTDIFVSGKIPRLSRTKIKKVLKSSGFDGSFRPLKANRPVVEGQTIIIYRPRPEEPDVVRDFGVLFEDEWILAIDKPAGLPVHPTARFHKNTLTEVIKERYGDNPPIIAHRIDSETSGVLLLAKIKEAERRLKIMFARRQIGKVYLAVVKGKPEPEAAKIELPIGPDVDSPVWVKMACASDGLPALTEYRVISSHPGFSLLECRPRTGRQHQIRAHLSHIGHPIIGDKMYGDDHGLFLDYLDEGKTTPDIEKRAGARRQLLHALSVSFVHPITRCDMEIKSPIPEDISDYIKSHS